MIYAALLFVPFIFASAPQISLEALKASIPAYDTGAVESATNSIAYMRDGKGEEYKPAARTWEDKTGDCEDFALLTRELTKDWPGCQSKIVTYQAQYAPLKYHAVNTLTCDNGLTGAFNNGTWEASWKRPS